MAEQEKVYQADYQDNILTLSFVRPHAGNAIPSYAVPELIELLENINKRPEIRAVLVRGEGPNFSVGGDVKGFSEALKRPIEEVKADFDARLARTARYVGGFVGVEAPVVTVCQGGSAGAGLMWSLGADVVIADESAYFLFAHQRVGLTPDGGVSYLLPRVVGVRRATELVITAARIDATEAHRLGIVSRIVPATHREDEARKQAQRFAKAPQSVLRRAKRLMNDSQTQSFAEQMEAERRAIVESVGDPDFAEGVAAFMEKRGPNFPSAR